LLLTRLTGKNLITDVLHIAPELLYQRIVVFGEFYVVSKRVNGGKIVLNKTTFNL